MFVFRLARLSLVGLVIVASMAAARPSEQTATLPATPDVKEIRLDNGLRIFVLERSASPTFAALYQFDVGGAVDPKGRSGIAHLLEHMMFKGTTSIGTLDPEKEQPLMARLGELWRELQSEREREEDPFQEADLDKIERIKRQIGELSAEHKKLIIKNEYDELMTRAGAVSLNASTGNDVTTYLVQLPANRLEFWFRSEAERLMNPVFREFYSERDVVAEERRLRYENSPRGLIYESLRSLMFAAHPYGTPVIGWPRDIQSLEREDALDYFRTYYSPSNCVMVLAGDVKAPEVERLAKKYLGAWKPQEIPRPVVTDEPEQRGERRSVVEFDAEPQLSIGWLTVPEGHPDQYALDVAARILGGLRSSRLDKTVVQEERIALSVATGHSTLKHGGYFSASGTLRGEHEPAKLEQAIEREIKRIGDEGVSAEELERAKIGVEVSRVRGLKSNLGQAFRIATSVRLTGSTDYIQEYEKRIGAVSAQDVQRVVGLYLRPGRKNVVELRKVPGAGGGERGGPDVTHQRGGSQARGTRHSAGFAQMLESIRSAKPLQLSIPEIGTDVDRIELPSGITVFIKEDHSAPSVEMALAWLGGNNTAPLEELAVFELASDLLNEGGTEELDPIALEERKDELGMSFAYSLGSSLSTGSFWSLERNFDQSFRVAMDILMKPRLDEERLETIKGQYVERMRRRWESPGYGAYLIERWVFDRDHPRLGYVPTNKEIVSITPEQIRRVWRRYVGRDNLYVTVVGDFDKDEMLEKIESTLGKWRKAENAERVFITRDPVVRPGLYVVEKKIPQPVVRIRHHIAVDRTAPLKDHAALEILNDILGGSGFRSRLMERLRSDEGLTYGIGSFISHQGRPRQPGVVGISYSTKKASVAHSVDSVLDEFTKIVREKVTGPEVEEQIEAWRNRFIFRYTNDFSIVSRLMFTELDDRPYDFDRQELEAVQKVTVDEVRRVARKYLKPEKLSVSVFGTLTPEDRTSLGERFPLKILSREQVFTGGYDETGITGETEEASAAN